MDNVRSVDNVINVGNVDYKGGVGSLKLMLSLPRKDAAYAKPKTLRLYKTLVSGYLIFDGEDQQKNAAGSV